MTQTNESAPPSHADSATSSSGTEKRISTVIGDRLCIKCSFNLAGQPVFRENVYGMAIVRCPECSTVASLQEHPLLGRWAGRFAAVLAGIWLLMLIGGIFASGGVLFGMSQGCLQNGSYRLATEISVKHSNWLATASAADSAIVTRMYGGGTIPTGPQSWIDGVWWKRQDPKQLVAGLGGPFKAIDPSIAEVLFWTAFIALVLGALWSIFLLHTRRFKLMFFALLPLGLALLFAYMSNSSVSRTWMWAGPGTVLAMHEAERILWPWIISICLMTCFVAFCIGIWIGRPLVRRLAWLLLPPRMLGSIAYLWIAEGKHPPRPRRDTTPR
jgi:hypothetical protein